MATQYLILASAAAAKAATEADWAVRVYGRPVPASNGTKALWGFISNAAGTIGVITDNVPMSGLSAAEQAALVDETNPTVIAVLAAAEPVH